MGLELGGDGIDPPCFTDGREVNENPNEKCDKHEKKKQPAVKGKDVTKKMTQIFFRFDNNQAKKRSYRRHASFLSVLHSPDYSLGIQGSPEAACQSRTTVHRPSTTSTASYKQ